MFIFKTTTTVKNPKYWILSDIISEFKIDTNDLTTAIEEFRNFAEKQDISITNNAIKCKSPMYIDTLNGTKQVGYTFNASTDIYDDDTQRFTKQRLALWVEILTVIPTVF